MDEQMFCFQCEQAANGTACTGRAGVCGKSAPTAAAQDRLTGALIRYAEQLIGEGRAPAPEQALLLMQGLFTTITNVNFDEHTVGQLIEKIHAACPGIAEEISTNPSGSWATMFTPFRISSSTARYGDWPRATQAR